MSILFTFWSWVGGCLKNERAYESILRNAKIISFWNHQLSCTFTHTFGWNIMKSFFKFLAWVLTGVPGFDRVTLEGDSIFLEREILRFQITKKFRISLLFISYSWWLITSYRKRKKPTLNWSILNIHLLCHNLVSMVA